MAATSVTFALVLALLGVPDSQSHCALLRPQEGDRRPNAAAFFYDKHINKEIEVKKCPGRTKDEPLVLAPSEVAARRVPGATGR